MVGLGENFTNITMCVGWRGVQLSLREMYMKMRYEASHNPECSVWFSKFGPKVPLGDLPDPFKGSADQNCFP